MHGRTYRKTLVNQSCYHHQIYATLFHLGVVTPIRSLAEASKAVKVLRKKFCRGETTLNDNPKTVWEREPLFAVHKLDNILNKFNRIKVELMKQDFQFSKLIYVP